MRPWRAGALSDLALANNELQLQLTKLPHRVCAPTDVASCCYGSERVRLWCVTCDVCGVMSSLPRQFSQHTLLLLLRNVCTRTLCLCVHSSRLSHVHAATRVFSSAVTRRFGAFHPSLTTTIHPPGSLGKVGCAGGGLAVSWGSVRTCSAPHDRRAKVHAVTRRPECTRLARRSAPVHYSAMLSSVT
jgi:hypothetical protein